MKRRAILWAGGVVVVAIIQFWSLDGLFGNAFLLLFGDDTSYSSRYSYWRFRSVDIGDSEASVIEKLGEPLETVETEDPPIRVLYFSMSPASTHYRIRAIEVRRGVVVKKYAQAWVD